MIVTLCLMLLVTAVNGGALTLAKNFGDGVTPPGAIVAELARAERVLENCCDDGGENVLPRPATPCSTDCSALVPFGIPALTASALQGTWFAFDALTEGPGQTWQRPPRA